MVEAMACGTPVLAFRNASVSEVIDDGLTGVVVESMEEAHARLGEVLARVIEIIARRPFD